MLSLACCFPVPPPLPPLRQYNDTAGVAASAVVATTEPVGGPGFTLQAGTTVRVAAGYSSGSGGLLHPLGAPHRRRCTESRAGQGVSKSA